MKRLWVLGLTCAAALSGCGIENDYFFTTRGERVYAVEDGVFEVALMDMGYLPGYWCNAADYARRSLGAGWTDPVYVYRGLGEGVVSERAVTVLFTLKPPATPVAQQAIVRINAFEPGQSLTVRSAENQCNFNSFEF